MAGPLRKKSRTARGVGATLTAKVNRLLNAQELKFLDVSNAALTVGAGGTVVALNSMAAGDDANTRNGRRIALVSSMFRFHMLGTDGIATAPVGQRICIVYDRDSRGGSPAWTDVFQVTQSVTDRNVNNKDRFVVVYDNFMSRGKGDLSQSTPNTAGAGFETGIYDAKFTKLTGMNAEYANTAANTPITGGLYLMALSDVDATMRYYHRVNYNDS